MSYKVDGLEIDGLSIKLIYVDDSIPAWEKDRTQLHRGYTLVITNEGNHSEEFDFWGSVAQFESEEDPSIKDVLECILMDALNSIGVGFSDIDDFAESFGYTKVSEVIRASEGCKETYEKLEKLGLDVKHITKMEEELRE